MIGQELEGIYEDEDEEELNRSKKKRKVDEVVEEEKVDLDEFWGDIRQVHLGLGKTKSNNRPLNSS